MIFIETVQAVEQWLQSGALEPATIQALDLAPLDAQFSTVRVECCIFLGCKVGNRLAEKIYDEKAGLVTELPVLPKSLPAFAPGIYTVADLYRGMREDGSGWETDRKSVV